MTGKRKTGKLIAGGALTGVANGLFGGGGGMVAVPALRVAAGYSTLRAHATALAAVLPATLVSGIIYLLNGFVSLKQFVPVCLGVILGGILGAKLLPHVPERAVTFVFAALMLAAGLRLIF